MVPNPIRRWIDAVRLLGLTRLGLVLSAVSGGWLMTYLAFGLESDDARSPSLQELGFGWGLLASAGVGLGLGVFAVAMNDVLDRRQDRLMLTDQDVAGKPVASGRVTPQAATAVAVGALLIAVLSAGALGPLSLKLAVLLGGAVLFYNVAGRFVPAVGVVTLGLIHGLALAIPNPSASFAWPVLLAMTHVMACGLMRHHFEGKRPRVRAWDVWGVVLGWGFWCLVVLMMIRTRQPVEMAESVSIGLWAGPAIAAAVFVVWARWEWSSREAENAALKRLTAVLGVGYAQRFRRLSVGWLLIYDAAWLFSLEMIWQGFTVIGLVFFVVLVGGGSPSTGSSEKGFIDELTVR